MAKPLNTISDFFRLIEKGEKCWLWTGCKNRGGYGLFGINKEQRLAHRISYEHHIGPIPDGMLVCHHCDTPACVNPAHLFLGTPKDNSQDCLRKGRNFNPPRRMKINAGQVLEIRRKYRRGQSRAIGEEYGISEDHVRRIVRRYTWRHI